MARNVRSFVRSVVAHASRALEVPRRRSFALAAGCLVAGLLFACGEGASVPDASIGRHRAALTASPTRSEDGAHWVIMRDVANVRSARTMRDWDARGKFVYDRLRTVAASSQASLVRWLGERNVPHRSFWIVNAVRVSADEGTLELIRRRPEVARVVPDESFSIPPLQPGSGIGPNVPDWGGEAIRAPEVWETFGVRGEGITVATIDTGVDYEHPALVGKYRGNQGDGSFDHDYNWFDPDVYCGGTPCDTDVHGTHVTGTMVGDDGLDAQIGMAPDARWIAAVGCPFTGCPTDLLLSTGQWMLAPTDRAGENPRPDLRPHVVNNSWGGPPRDEFFRGIVQSWVDAGIFPVFSAGNSGFIGCDSVGSPGDYPESFAVAAFDEFGSIADFSSRGPSGVDGVPKPDVAAPGVDVLSAFPGGEYGLLSGTSMAAPHVTGTIALMWSSAPSLVGDIEATRELLGVTAIDVDDPSCGGDGERNGVWGEGRIDAFDAVDQSPRGPSGRLVGDVLSSDGQPIAGALVNARNEEVNRSTRTSATGAYELRLPVGSYDLTASAFGYLVSRPRQVSIEEGVEVRRRVRLQVAPRSRLSGFVRDQAGTPLAGARVALVGTPLPPALTDESGAYSFAEVPHGAYEVRVDASQCYAAGLKPLELSGDAVLSFDLEQRQDDFGYHCAPAPFELVEATQPLDIFGFGEATVDLPFPFTLYGQTYREVTVTSAGFLTFDPNGFSDTFNTPIPNAARPNAAIYAFWDEIYVEPGYAGEILTETLGEAPNRRFVVEWRDVLVGFEFPVHFEVVLHERGDVELLYATGGTPRQRGSSATVGLEDARGRVAYQYSNNQPVLEAGTAIRFTLPPNGFVEGVVLDSSDEQPVRGAVVTATAEGFSSRSVTTDPSGAYRLQLPVGSYLLEASKQNYASATTTVDVAEDDLLERSFSLDTATVLLSPRTLQLVVPVGEQRRRTLEVENVGALPLEFEIAESGGRRATPLITRTLPNRSALQPFALDTSAVFADQDLPPIERGSLATGDILRQFTPDVYTYGLGATNERLWLSAFNCDARNCGTFNYEYTFEGEPTGRTTFLGNDREGYSLVFDAARNLMCQAVVTYNDFGSQIDCWNLETGEIELTVRGGSWSSDYVQAMTYDPETDTFYVTSYGLGIVHVAGASWPEPGEELGSCRPADDFVSGLAYNAPAGVLWAATNSPQDTIYQLNPEDCTVLEMLAHPGTGRYRGGALSMDVDGNLWMQNQSRGSVLLVDSGLPTENDVPWLVVEPSSGTVASGEQLAVEVSFDTSALEPGLYLARLIVQSNAGREPSVRIPVSLLVPAYRQAVNAGGSSFVDALGDEWAADQSHVPGDWGYYNPGPTLQTLEPIASTEEDALYQEQRVDPYAYRFDGVVDGIYEIELRFAEIEEETAFSERVFDVIAEGELLLPAYDMAYDVGTFQADDHRFFVEVADGRVDVRLVGGEGYKPPTLGALRVTHRPDR